MSALIELSEVTSQDVGWLVVLISLVYQLFWPFWETKLHKLLGGVADEVRDDITDIRTRLRSVDGKVEDIDDKQLAHIQVTRALASKEGDIDDEAVDEYLAHNGVTKDYFFSDESYSHNHPSDDD